MGVLTPIFLIAGLSVAVPLFLHLFHRQETRRLPFPALRYLERTEREHARRIRLRQLLLLVLRVAALLLLVGAGARLFVRGRGSSHPPTAVAVILDNSMSTGLVVGERRLFDDLRARALETLSAAGPEDRFWILPAAEPDVAVTPVAAAEARRLVEGIEVRASRADLSAALERAVELLRAAELAEREIHLLTDLQAAGFRAEVAGPAGDLPVVAYAPEAAGARNRALDGLVIGGGLPPLQGQRSEATISSMPLEEDTVLLPVRLVIDDRIRGAATLPAGASTSIPLPATGGGWVRGYAESDPDALRADDRRYFAYRSRPPTAVAVAGPAGVFFEQAVAVLDSAGRLVRREPSDAELVIAVGGEGLERLRSGASALILPPVDATVLPALNRRLADLGIPWRYEPRDVTGEADLVGERLPDPLEGVRASRWYRLVVAGDPHGPTSRLAEVADEPWAVEGTDALGHPYLLLASPLELGWSSLPLSSAMLRFVDWAATRWAGAGSEPAVLAAGEPLPAPRVATHARLPSGRLVEIDGTRTLTRTGEAGFYEFLADDTTVAVHALNPPAAESDLTRLDRRRLAQAVGGEVERVDAPGRWAGAIYRARQGPEIWWPLLAAAALLLLLEALLASSGRRRPSTTAIPVQKVPASADAA